MLVVKPAKGKKPTQALPNPQNNEFNRIFLESLDETLDQVLGENPTSMVYHYLQKYFSLGKKRIPAKLEDFAGALEELFGTEALLMEKIIVKDLYAKFDMDFLERGDFDFVEQVSLARRKIKERR